MPKPRLTFTPDQQARIRDGREADPPVHLKALAAELRCSVFRVWCEAQILAGRSVCRVNHSRARQAAEMRKPSRKQQQMHACMRCRTRMVPGWSFCRACKADPALVSDSPFDR